MQHIYGEVLVYLDVSAALAGRPFGTPLSYRPEPDSFEAPVMTHTRQVRTCPPTISFLLHGPLPGERGPGTQGVLSAV